MTAFPLADFSFAGWPEAVCSGNQETRVRLPMDTRQALEPRSAEIALLSLLTTLNPGTYLSLYKVVFSANRPQNG